MCIVYFATHAYCAHEQLLGAFACGLGCPVRQHHIFPLDEDGFLCETCMSLAGVVMDPEIHPVKYNPPLFDNDEPTEWDEHVREMNRRKRRMDMKTIPDAWVREKEGWDVWGRGEGEAEEKMSPGRAEHKKLVERQLKEMVPPQLFEKEMMKADETLRMNPQAAEFPAQTGGDGELEIVANAADYEAVKRKTTK